MAGSSRQGGETSPLSSKAKGMLEAEASRLYQRSKDCEHWIGFYERALSEHRAEAATIQARRDEIGAILYPKSHQPSPDATAVDEIRARHREGHHAKR